LAPLASVYSTLTDEDFWSLHQHCITPTYSVFLPAVSKAVLIFHSERADF
jgi:hypothetical protein